jgi:hypothetical protein
VTRIFEFFQKVAQTVSKPEKCQNIYNKAQSESPIHLHQTRFENLDTYNKICANVINVLNQNVAQNVTIPLGYFISSKNHHEPPKVA